jgi:hypothetical protein
VTNVTTRRTAELPYRTTAARYRLRDPDEVAALLRRMIPLLRARTAGRTGD